jgi:hypothetical protein
MFVVEQEWYYSISGLVNASRYARGKQASESETVLMKKGNKNFMRTWRDVMCDSSANSAR